MPLIAQNLSKSHVLLSAWMKGPRYLVRQEAMRDRGRMRSMREPSKTMELLATLVFLLELPKPTTRTSGIYIRSPRMEGQPSLKSIVNCRAKTRARQSVRTSVVVKAMESALLLPESHVPLSKAEIQDTRRDQWVTFIHHHLTAAELLHSSWVCNMQISSRASWQLTIS